MFGRLFLVLAVLQQLVDPASRPGELLQARSCDASVRDDVRLPINGDQTYLIDDDRVPTCLAPLFKSLGTEALRLTGKEDARAVLYVGVGRAFNSATLLFSSDGDTSIHYIKELSSISEVLSAEWSDYHSPDGDLGWSGFVLDVNKGNIRVRFLTSTTSPFATYDNAIDLEAKFFPEKTLSGDD